jgi:hypothetical protein
MIPGISSSRAASDALGRGEVADISQHDYERPTDIASLLGPGPSENRQLSNTLHFFGVRTTVTLLMLWRGVERWRTGALLGI